MPPTDDNKYTFIIRVSIVFLVIAGAIGLTFYSINNFDSLSRKFRSYWQQIFPQKVDYSFRGAPKKSGFALANENNILGSRILLAKDDDKKTPQGKFEIAASSVEFAFAKKDGKSDFTRE